MQLIRIKSAPNQNDIPKSSGNKKFLWILKVYDWLVIRNFCKFNYLHWLRISFVTYIQNTRESGIIILESNRSTPKMFFSVSCSFFCILGFDCAYVWIPVRINFNKESTGSRSTTHTPGRKSKSTLNERSGWSADHPDFWTRGSDHPEFLPCSDIFYEVIFPVNKQGSIESPQRKQRPERIRLGQHYLSCRHRRTYQRTSLIGSELGVYRRRPRDLIFSLFSKDCCQNPLASGALPRTPLGGLQRTRPLAGKGWSWPPCWKIVPAPLIVDYLGGVHVYSSM